MAIAGRALVGAGGAAVGWGQQAGPHVLGREIVAHRQAGLEQEEGVFARRHPLAAGDHLHLAAARQDVDAHEGIAGVDEHLLVLFEPVVQAVPVEGEMAGDGGAFVEGRLVAPGGVAGLAPAGTDRVIAGMALEGAPAAARRLRQQPHVGVVARHIVERDMPALAHRPGARRVEQGSAAEGGAQALGTGCQRDAMIGVFGEAGCGIGARRGVGHGCCLLDGACPARLGTPGGKRRPCRLRAIMPNDGSGDRQRPSMAPAVLRQGARSARERP